MSYEGTEEYLCKKGHLWAGPCTYGNEDAYPCPTCGTPPVWMHSIDDTNCDAVGHIPDEEWDKLLISPQVRETCNLGHSHVKEEARYRQPTGEELKEMQHYWDSAKNAYVRLSSPRANRRT